MKLAPHSKYGWNSYMKYSQTKVTSWIKSYIKSMSVPTNYFYILILFNDNILVAKHSFTDNLIDVECLHWQGERCCCDWCQYGLPQGVFNKGELLVYLSFNIANLIKFMVYTIFLFRCNVVVAICPKKWYLKTYLDSVTPVLIYANCLEIERPLFPVASQ